MTISDLFVYPVKSLAGIRVDSVAVTARGFEHDRRWMIVDPDGTFVSQRSMPSLARIRTSIDGESIILASNEGSVRMPIRPLDAGSRRTVTIWGDEVCAVRAAPQASDWLSGILGESVELVWMPDDSDRSPDPNHSGEGDRVSFADGYPILLTATASLAALNRHLAEPVPMNRFRPNMVVVTESAWQEEAWRGVSTAGDSSAGVSPKGNPSDRSSQAGDPSEDVSPGDAFPGDVDLDVVKPCSRCVVTTVPQYPATDGQGEPGSVGSGHVASIPTETPQTEPLRTLARIHRIDGKAVFGVNLIPRSYGRIRTGDELRVKRTVAGA